MPVSWTVAHRSRVERTRVSVETGLSHPPDEPPQARFLLENLTASYFLGHTQARLHLDVFAFLLWTQFLPKAKTLNPIRGTDSTLLKNSI